jgi:hypothetical protein
MKNLFFILSLFFAMVIVFGTILMLGHNHLGDYAVILGSIGAVFTLRKLDNILSK